MAGAARVEAVTTKTIEESPQSVAEGFVAGTDAVVLQLQDHDRLLALYRYWDEKRQSKPMPSRADIDPIEMEPWLGNLNLVDVNRDPPGFRYRVFGTQIAMAIGRELTGLTVDDNPPGAAGRIRESYQQVARTGEPLFCSQDIEAIGTQLRHARLLLPIGTKDRLVEMILAAGLPR